MAALVQANNIRQERTARVVDKHNEDLKRMARTGDRRRERRWDLTLASVMVTGSALANVLVTVLHH